MEAKVKKIEQIARDVYKQLGSGHQEVIYDRAMQVGLRLAGFKYQNQKVVELLYKNHYVGEGYPDIVVDIGREQLVLELKSVGGKMGEPEKQQLRNYLKLMKIKHGLLINFQQPNRKGDKTEVEVLPVT